MQAHTHDIRIEHIDTLHDGPGAGLYLVGQGHAQIGFWIAGAGEKIVLLLEGVFETALRLYRWHAVDRLHQAGLTKAVAAR